MVARVPSVARVTGALEARSQISKLKETGWNVENALFVNSLILMENCCTQFKSNEQLNGSDGSLSRELHK
jgi:hypothetical protein